MQISCSKRGILNSTHMLQMPPTYPRSPLSHQQLRLCSFLYLNLHKIFEFTMPLNENLLPLLTLKRISAKKDSSWLTGLTSQPESNSHCSQRSLIHAAFQEKKTQTGLPSLLHCAFAIRVDPYKRIPRIKNLPIRQTFPVQLELYCSLHSPIRAAPFQSIRTVLFGSIKL